ncbi:hypothetical protein KHQ81_03750 [Mycoplasmatota bacterium]|nr:hypothetical protein KHQ81_03750 [Mycoplasmatota bacterium]
MRKSHLHILLFISALIGALFNFIFLINRPLNTNELTAIEIFASPINHILFFIALFLMFYTFFIQRKLIHILGMLLILLGLLYLVLMFSFVNVSFYYLIPLGLYLLTGFSMLGYQKKYQ